jgi:transcriptional regulator with XRE-family HTH domain
MAWKEHTRTRLGPKFSEGARQLWLLLEARGWSQTRLMSELGTTGLVPGWLYGDKKPSLDNAFRLKALFGIEPELWARPPAKPFVLPAAAPKAA